MYSRWWAGSRFSQAAITTMELGARRWQRFAIQGQDRGEMHFGAFVRQAIEVATKRERRRAGPVERQQRRRKLRIAQQHASKGVNQQRAQDEALLRVAGRSTVVAKCVDHAAEAGEEAAIVGGQCSDVPRAVDRRCE